MTGEFIVRYTNKDIMKKLEDLHEDQVKTLEQAKKTNGRVNNLEKKSLGLWISNNPFKFTLFILIFTVIVISDLRHPIIGLLLQFL